MIEIRQQKINLLCVRIVYGIVIGFVCMTLVAALFAKLILSSTIPETMLNVAAFATNFIGVLIGGVVACGKEKRLQRALITVAIVVLLQLAIHAIIFENLPYTLTIQSAGIPTAVVLALLIRFRSERKYRKYR